MRFSTVVRVQTCADLFFFLSFLQIECWQSLGIGRESDALRMRITRVLWQRWTDKPARKFIKRLLSNEIK
jgi:hypothetical protein